VRDGWLGHATLSTMPKSAQPGLASMLCTRRSKRATWGGAFVAGGGALGACAGAADVTPLDTTATDTTLDAAARCSDARSLQAARARAPANKNPNLTGAVYSYARS
jgi:hypothetical protein